LAEPAQADELAGVGVAGGGGLVAPSPVSWLRPGRPADAGEMDTDGGTATWPLLLVRRAGPAGGQHVTALLRPVVADPAELGGLVRRGSVFVLSDLMLPLSAPPVAAVVFRHDPMARTALLTGIAVRCPRAAEAWPALLRADGFGQVHAGSGWAMRGRR
jgi:hypothetical protein